MSSNWPIAPVSVACRGQVTGKLVLTYELALANISLIMQTTALNIVMRTLADPTRRAVFERIVHAGEISVAELTEGSGVSQSAISQHLASLRRASLVTDRAQGRNVFYRADPKGLEPLADWMGHYGVFWRKRFADLRSLLKEIDP